MREGLEHGNQAPLLAAPRNVDRERIAASTTADERLRLRNRRYGRPVERRNRVAGGHAGQRARRSSGDS
jgi:hypothetical protein